MANNNRITVSQAIRKIQMRFTSIPVNFFGLSLEDVIQTHDEHQRTKEHATELTGLICL